MSEKMARNALSFTESDVAFLAATLAIPSAAQLLRLDSRPTARSITRRR